MARHFKNSRGQFMPIASMVVFTIVVFIFAVISIYKVAKTKLLLQNIADAVSLEIVSHGAASSMNFVADRNEWLNHLYSDPSQNLDPTDPKSPAYGGCPRDLSNYKRIPGISCVDAKYKFSFPSDPGAVGYARLVKSVNDSTILAAKAYDTFSGVNVDGSTGQKSLQDILYGDIADLRTDGSIQLITWNSDQKEEEAQPAIQQATQQAEKNPTSNSKRVQAFMAPMSNALVAHDVMIAIDGKHKITGTLVKGYFHKTLAQELGLPSDQHVGWMEVDPKNLPQVTLPGSHAQRIGAGALVLKPVTILGMTFVVSARSEAYLVPGSGQMPVKDSQNEAPVFMPSYWVKLVTPHE